MSSMSWSRRRCMSTGASPAARSWPSRPGGRLHETRGHCLARFTGLLWLLFLCTGAVADDVEKVLFLVVEKDDVVASNALTGRIDRLELHAKERIEQYKVANAVAVVVTNQRYAAYAVPYGAWQSLRVRAQEETESVQVADYSATVVTSDRILNFYGRRGAWSEAPRSVQLD
jgi:hypothetical protein